MFETLTARLNQSFDRLRRRGKLSEADVDEALREIRLALLEADVNFAVAKEFLDRIRQRAIGAEVSRALNPGQQVVKIVHDELITTLGERVRLHLAGPRPRTVMLVGLQGSGKTTTAAKLARRLKSSGERVLLVAADRHRPAAVEQLQQLAQRIDVAVEPAAGGDTTNLARRAQERAAKGGMGVVILDTAGRSQLDDALMHELRSVAAAVHPVETLLVLDAMTGQESVHIAQGFQEAIPVTGLVLTKMDGDARGGAAISIRRVAGIPVKFIGTGEKLDSLEEFDPVRVADRILGMGDVVGLIEKAESLFSKSDARVEAEKILGTEFNLEDWLRQMKQVRQLGSMAQIMEMLPGPLGRAARQASPDTLDQGFKKSEAIIQSMTRKERRDPGILNASRRRRIAVGSGSDIQAVNRLLKQFREAQKLMKVLRKSGGADFGKLLG